jgi:hypothetical protein
MHFDSVGIFLARDVLQFEFCGTWLQISANVNQISIIFNGNVTTVKIFVTPPFLHTEGLLARELKVTRYDSSGSGSLLVSQLDIIRRLKILTSCC